MNHEQMLQSAELLARGRLQSSAMDAPPGPLRPSNAVEAYAIQHLLHERYRDAGRGAVSGYKVGCTTPVMQRYLAIDHPCAGGVLAPTAHRRVAELAHGDFCRVGVECEIAVRLGKDLPPRDGGYDRDAVASAVDSVMPAIEIVDDRWRDFTSVDAFSLMADDFFGAGAVLGDAVAFTAHTDLAGVSGRMSVNDALAGEGTGSDILGHPLNALAWLASSGAPRGGLRAGQFVLLGSLVKTCWLDPGDRVDIHIHGLGGAGLTVR
jgi:2-oxo-3-hexenedioate decarboxylase/2-keto-4-pentenoate hydratase